MKHFALLAAIPLLAACQTTAGDDYPSLAVRDAERVSGTLQPAAPYVPEPVRPEVTSDLGRLTAEVASAEQTFAQATPAAQRAVSAARGGGVGSEAWSVAQVALAGLESARSRAMIALADLDRLYVAAATEGTDLAPIAAAREAAIATVDGQNATIDALIEGLS